MLEEKQTPREWGSKSFKKQFEALFDKTFNIFILESFFSLTKLSFLNFFLLFATTEGTWR